MEGREGGRKEGSRPEGKKPFNSSEICLIWEKNIEIRINYTVPCFLMDKTVYPHNRDENMMTAKEFTLFLKDPANFMDIWDITGWGQQFYSLCMLLACILLHFQVLATGEKVSTCFPLKLNVEAYYKWRKISRRWTLSKKSHNVVMLQVNIKSSYLPS